MRCDARRQCLAFGRLSPHRLREALHVQSPAQRPLRTRFGTPFEHGEQIAKGRLRRRTLDAVRFGSHRHVFLPDEQRAALGLPTHYVEHQRGEPFTAFEGVRD